MIRKVTLKASVLLLVATMLVVVSESTAFWILGRNGWMLSGPTAAHEPFVGLWHERFGLTPASNQDPMVLVPVMPPRETAAGLYRAEEGAAAQHMEVENGLVIYNIRGGPQIPHLPPVHSPHSAFINRVPVWPHMAGGRAIVSPDGKLWCRVTVKLPYSFHVREYEGTVDDFMPSSSAKGWRTASIHPYLLAHNVAIALLLFGWPFFVGDARAVLRRWRACTDEQKNRLPRPITLRAIGLRSACLVIAACAIVLVLDSILFPAATQDGPSITLNTVAANDKAWWAANMGELPPQTMGPIPAPPAIEAGLGTWLIPRGGHGGPGVHGRDAQRFAESLVAYSVVPNPERSKLWPVRGRVLAGSDGRIAYRLYSPLPFAIRERTYVARASDEFVPNPTDTEWQIRFRPLGYLASVALLIIVLGAPVYWRDAHALVRMMRGRCTSCGYPLRDLQGPRCPECGCALGGIKELRG